MLTELSIDFLKSNLPFYNKLTMEQQELFISKAFESTMKDNNVFHTSYKECTGLIIVIDGILRVFLNSEEGKEITLYKLLAGDCCVFTSSCIFNNINFQVNLETIEDSRVIILPSKFVDYLSKNNIEFQQYILQLTQSKMSEVMYLMEQILFTSFDKRLKDYLLSFNSEHIEITHNKIAKDLGTAREVVSRILKHFENQGMIKVSRGSIDLINLS